MSFEFKHPSYYKKLRALNKLNKSKKNMSTTSSTINNTSKSVNTSPDNT